MLTDSATTRRPRTLALGVVEALSDLLDGLVTAVLVWWHFVGANTADDGYILTMARVSEHAGYMANYYRWFGTPEAPFGWYYDLLALWAQVSTHSVWMRLPTLLMALACWWVISREVIPRLGHAVKANRAAAWTARWSAPTRCPARPTAWPSTGPSSG